MLAPKLASHIQIQSYKHDGKIHRIWEKNFVLKSTETIIIGANDRTKVLESDGRIWLTREPAVFYFDVKRWFNIIGMMKDDGVHYYCNISSPFVYDQEALKYIDYDLDVKVFPDMTYLLLDEDEYAVNKLNMSYPKELDQILKYQLEILFHWIKQRKGPFSLGFIEDWYDRFLTYSGAE